MRIKLRVELGLKKSIIYLSALYGQLFRSYILFTLGNHHCEIYIIRGGISVFDYFLQYLFYAPISANVYLCFYSGTINLVTCYY